MNPPAFMSSFSSYFPASTFRRVEVVSTWAQR
jgi:hypothetical protein